MKICIMVNEELIVQNNILYNTKYLQLKSTMSKIGKDWVYAHRPNANDVVIIVPVINKQQVLFIIEERPPLVAEGITNRSIAVPAGLVGDERKGESIEEAIRAELLEEAGLVADKIVIKTRRTASSPGCISETVTIAIAYIKEYKLSAEPISDGGVIVDRVLVNIEDIYSWLREKEKDGYALTAQTLAGLFYLQENNKEKNV